MSPVERSAGGGGGSTSPLTTKGDIWGFDTINDRIPVGTNRQVLTADSAQALGVRWANGASNVFDSTLGVDGTTIDTGANGVPSGFSALLVCSQTRTSAAGATDTLFITINGDGGANYDREVMSLFTNATTSFGASTGLTSWGVVTHGSGGAASYAAPNMLFIPNYTGTTFFKSAFAFGGVIDSNVANTTVAVVSFGWRSTVAINQLTFSSSGSNIKAGSRVTIYGLP